MPFGLALGLLLGTLGGGGSILAVPVLVYVLGEPVQTATTESLLVVGAAALVGAFDYRRVGRVRVKTALAFGVAGASGSLAGTALNRIVSGDAILLAFGFVVFAAAYMMFRGRPIERDPARRVPLWLVGAAGVATGALTGFFGIGGGFVILPVLVLLLGLPLTLAVGTSLLAIAITSAGALAFHLASGSVHWGLAGTFTAAAIVGALAGRRVGDRIDPRRLTRGFALLLVAIASMLVVTNLGAVV